MMPPNTAQAQKPSTEETSLLTVQPIPQPENQAGNPPLAAGEPLPLTQSRLARCLQVTADLTLCDSNRTFSTIGLGRLARIWRLCASNPASFDISTHINYLSLRRAALITLAGLLCTTKLIQVMGQTGFSVAQGGGNTNLLLISGLLSNVITTSLTRLSSLVDGLRQLLVPAEISQAAAERRRIAREHESIEGCGRRFIYSFLKYLLTGLSISSIVAKGIIGGLSGFILALLIEGYSPEEIHDLKTGRSEYMPGQSHALLWIFTLLTGLTTGISACCFDYLRADRARDTIHRYAYKISQSGFPSFHREDQACKTFKGTAIAVVAGGFSASFAVLSIAYAYASLNMALDVLPQFFSGTPIPREAINTIRIASAISAVVGVVPIMMSAGKDTQQMFTQIFLQNKAFSFLNAFQGQLQISACGKRIVIPQIIKQLVMPFGLLFLVGLGMIDVYNNTIGVAGSLDSLYDQLRPNNGTQHEQLFLGLATLSTVTYFANNSWLALMIVLHALGVISGTLLASNDDAIHIGLTGTNDDTRHVALTGGLLASNDDAIHIGLTGGLFSTGDDAGDISLAEEYEPINDDDEDDERSSRLCCWA